MKFLVAVIFFSVLVFVSLEAGARWILGFGTPPLYQIDALLEYRMKPNQRVYRFGHLVETNERGMRSPSLVGEKRQIVLSLGDSVLNGGSQIDQSELATTLLSNHKMVYANFSSGSWGPANLLAALTESEDIPTTAVILVLNSDDLGDVPTWEPLDKDHPTENPPFALWELVIRYIPRLLVLLTSHKNQLDKSPKTAEGNQKFFTLLEYLSHQQKPSCIVLSPRKSEAIGQKSENYTRMQTAIKAYQIHLIDAAKIYRSALDVDKNLYLDGIHLTA